MHEAALSLTHSWTGQRARAAVCARGLVNRSGVFAPIGEDRLPTTSAADAAYVGVFARATYG